jgi:dihydroflavonol-4-reductase
MTTALVTGATGLIGANICAQLAAAGARVRAIVRDPATAGPLADLGADVRPGDVTDAASVLAAAAGCDYCIHAAAVAVGGPSYPERTYREVNLEGTRNVLSTAERTGLKRVVVLSTGVIFDRSAALTEGSATRADGGGSDPYARTKLMAFHETMRRVDAGLDAVVVVPGATFGPSPIGMRAVSPPGFNDRIRQALLGQIDVFPAGRYSFVLASDVASAAVAALTRGAAGDRFLAYGADQEMTLGVDLLNFALERAGSSFRVRALRPDEHDRPEVRERFGPAILRSAASAVTASFDNSLTRSALGYDPVSAERAAAVTVDWLRRLYPAARLGSA